MKKIIITFIIIFSVNLGFSQQKVSDLNFDKMTLKLMTVEELKSVLKDLERIEYLIKIDSSNQVIMSLLYQLDNQESRIQNTSQILIRENVEIKKNTKKLNESEEKQKNTQKQLKDKELKDKKTKKQLKEYLMKFLDYLELEKDKTAVKAVIASLSEE